VGELAGDGKKLDRKYPVIGRLVKLKTSHISLLQINILLAFKTW
jgi:hypothetical protein